jgi:hypothetical protein
MKKQITISILCILLCSIVAAENLIYDSENLNYAKLAISNTDSARVRFTPTLDGNLTSIQLYWRVCASCPVGAHFDLLISDNTNTITLNDQTPSFDIWQNIPVNNFPVHAGQSFNVTVRKHVEGPSCLCLALSAPDYNTEDRSYAFAGSTPYSLENTTGNWPYPKMDIVLRAYTTTPSKCVCECGAGYTCKNTASGDSKYCDCQTITTTTIPFRGGGGGGGGGGGTTGKANCYDNIKNCHDSEVRNISGQFLCELDTDCGGPCEACPSCSDGIQNQAETGIDCGGPCALCTIVLSGTNATTTTTTEAASTTTTTAEATTTTTQLEAPGITGLVLGAGIGGMGIFLFLLFLLLLVIYLYIRWRKGGKK